MNVRRNVFSAARGHVAASPLEPLEQLPVAVGEHRVVQRVLRIEVLVQRRLAYPDLAGQRVERDAADAVLPSELPGCLRRSTPPWPLAAAATLAATVSRPPAIAAWSNFLSLIGTLPISDRKSKRRVGAVHRHGVVASVGLRLAIQVAYRSTRSSRPAAAVGVVFPEPCSRARAGSRRPVRHRARDGRSQRRAPLRCRRREQRDVAGHHHHVEGPAQFEVVRSAAPR